MMRCPSCETLTDSNACALRLTPGSALRTCVQVVPRSVDMYRPPWYWSATMRSPLALMSLEIQVRPVGLLPAVQVMPPSTEVLRLPPPSPATSTSPEAFDDTQCQT